MPSASSPGRASVCYWALLYVYPSPSIDAKNHQKPISSAKTPAKTKGGSTAEPAEKGAARITSQFTKLRVDSESQVLCFSRLWVKGKLTRLPAPCRSGGKRRWANGHNLSSVEGGSSSPPAQEVPLRGSSGWWPWPAFVKNAERLRAASLQWRRVPPKQGSRIGDKFQTQPRSTQIEPENHQNFFGIYMCSVD